jgi:hypothetical protein
MEVLLLFVNLVRWLHDGAHMPIVLAIVLSEAVYLGLASLLNLFVHKTPVVFWSSLGLLIVAGVDLLALLPQKQEMAFRSPMPIVGKVAAIAGVVVVIVILKQILGGFMTMFPMVGTIAVYEARRSLWTISRQIPILIVTAGPMMGAMWLAQHFLHASIPISLLGGWAVFLTIMIPLTFTQMRRAAAAT